MSGDAATERDEARDFPYWSRNLRVLPAATLLSALAFALSFPFLPLVVRGLGIREHLETWVGYMMLVFYLIGFVVSPIWGAVADHYGRKVMVLRAMLGMGFFMALLPFATSPLWFAAMFMLVGIFNGANSAINSLLVANTPPRRIGSSLALTQSGALVGQTIGPAVGALLAAMVVRKQWMFWISGGMMLCGGLLVVFLVHEVKRRASGPWRFNWVGDLRELVAVPGIGPLYLLCFMFSVLWSGNTTIITIYALQLLAAQPVAASTEAYWVGAAAMGLSVSGVLALPLWGRLLDRCDPARVLTYASVAALLANIPLLVLQTPLQLVLARVACGLAASGMMPAILRLLKERAPRRMDARAISYATSFGFIASGLAPFCAGLIGPALGLRAYFALTIVCTLAGVIMWVRRR